MLKSRFEYLIILSASLFSLFILTRINIVVSRLSTNISILDYLKSILPSELDYVQNRDIFCDDGVLYETRNIGEYKLRVGVCSITRGDYEQSAIFLSDYPNSSFVYAREAELLYIAGIYREAQKLFLLAIKNPLVDSVPLNIRNAFESKVVIRLCSIEYRLNEDLRWCQNKRSGTWGKYYLGVKAYDDKEYALAYSYFVNAYESQQNNIQFGVNLIRSLAKLNRCDEAKYYFDRMLEVNPKEENNIISSLINIVECRDLLFP